MDTARELLEDATTVLVIDDDPGVRKTLRRVLKRQGHACLEAAGAFEGLTVARERRPDVIVLDIGLPDADGRDLLCALRADPVASGIPVVVISGDVDQYRRMSALAAGAEEVVEKPFDPVMLRRRLEWMVTKKREAAN